MIKPAIVAVGYNRPYCMERLLSSIGKAKYELADITMIISIDDSNNSDAVEQVAKDFEWKYGDKIIRRFHERQGLKKHIIACGDLSEEYECVIILEDDLFVAPDFYNYVCDAQSYYKSDTRIVGVALYSYGLNQFNQNRFIPVRNQYDNYLGQFSVTWGQSWRAEQWIKFKEWFLKNDDALSTRNDKMPLEILRWKRSWGKYFISYMVEHDLYYVVPYTALSTNFSEQGEHYEKIGYETAYQVSLMSEQMEYRFAPFDKAIKYDSFYERIYDGDVLPGISAKDICFDLYGVRVYPLGKQYLLTCKKYDFPRIKTFGLRMRPHEQNVFNNIKGDGINLYRIHGDERLYHGKRRKSASEIVPARARYEAEGLPYRVLLPLSIRLFCEAASGKLKRILKNFKCRFKK